MIWWEVILSILTVAISILSLFIAGWAFFNSRSTNKKMIEIESARDRREKAEKAKALVYASLERLKPGSYELIFSNAGNGEARLLKILLDEKPFLEHPTLYDDAENLTYLDRKSSAKYDVRTTLNKRPPLQCKLTWEDDSGEPGKWEGRLGNQ